MADAVTQRNDVDLRHGSMVTCTETETNSSGERPAWAEPVSPVGRLFLEPHLSCYIVCVFGLGAPVDLAAVRHGLETTLVHHPRFCSVQVMEKSKGVRLKWLRTTVNLDDHVIVPNLNPTVTPTDADRAMEEYLSSVSTLSMDQSRPLWELHVLDFPTVEAAATLAFRIHHSLGDGISLLSLLVACACPAVDAFTVPQMLPIVSTRRIGPVHAMLLHPTVSTLLTWIMSILVLVWHTVLDVVLFGATASLILHDPPTLFKGAEGVEFRPKRFLNCTLSLDDVKYVKNVMNCTVNDVLLGVASAALPRYYFRKTGESSKRSIRGALGSLV